MRLLVSLCLLIAVTGADYMPVVAQIEKILPGVFVYSVEIGSNIVEDEIHGFIGNADEEVESVCQYVTSSPELQGGFNAVGFSQGSQFLRALVERCAGAKVHNLITMGGQHQGVADIPNCEGLTNLTEVCDDVQYLLSFGAYTSLAQDLVIQAQYFKDPLDYASYLSANKFLTDINNELTEKNETYKERDTVVVPRESEWFGYYQIGDLDNIIPIWQQPIYTEDWIGLQELNATGRLHLLSCPGEHMNITLPWFTEQVILPWLSVSA